MAIPLVLATFMGMNFWAEKLVAFTGLEISPWVTGGEVRQTVEHDLYKTLIHRPVFDGLIGERRTGFVQITWEPNEVPLPTHIDEEIDFDSDGRNDFRIKLDTKTNEAELQAFHKNVVSLGEVLVMERERILRVSLKRKSN
jgi:hypothetical protein